MTFDIVYSGTLERASIAAQASAHRHAQFPAQDGSA